MTKKSPSTKTWFLVHVFFPMLPFIIEFFLRLFILGLSLDVFSSSSTLAASIGLLCLFINQNLLAHSIPLSDNNEQNELTEIATIFLILGIINFMFFTALLFFTINPEEHDIPKIRFYIVYFVIYIGAIFVIRQAYMTQRRFKLRAVI
jgi:uncharacterized membrane protein